MRYLRYFVTLMKLTEIPFKFYLLSSFLGGLLGMYLYQVNNNLYVPIEQIFFLHNNNYRFLATLFVFCIPIVVSIYFCRIYFDEIDVYPTVFTKIKSKKFQYLRLMITFIQAFLLVLVFLLSNLLVMYLSLRTDNSAFYNIANNYRINIVDNPYAFYSIFINNPLLFTYLYIVLISVYSGLSAMFSYSISVFTNNKTTAYLSGFMFSILFILIASFFDNGIIVWYPQNLFLPFSMTATNPGNFSIYKGMIVIISVYLISSIVVLELAFRKRSWYD